MPTTRTPEEVRSALAVIPSDDRPTWVEIGMALHSELGEIGYSIWDEWSRTAHNYNERDSLAVWRGFSADGPIRIGTLFHIAGKFGWKAGACRAEIPRKRAHNEKGRLEEIEETGGRAARIWQLATPAPDNHPYLVRKQIQPHGIRVLGCLFLGAPQGVRNDGNLLVIPMKDLAGNVWSIEFVSNSKKQSLRGRRLFGLTYCVGHQPQHDDEPIYLAEGFATAAAVYEEKKIPAFCSFSSGNLMSVGKILRDHYFHKPIKIMADDDWAKKKNTGITTAHSVAKEINAEVVIPDFTGLNPAPDDTDYNDWRRLHYAWLRQAGGIDEDSTGRTGG